MRDLKLLFTPIRIAGMEVKNRIVMSPMSTNLGTPQGYVTPALIRYFTARARGGVGLIITGDVSIDPKGRYQERTLGLYDDHFIPAWKDLTRAVHSHGAKIGPQLIHPSFNAHSALTGVQPVAASPIASRRFRELPRELRVDEIEKIIEEFADAALRVQEAGCDAVQLHCAHSHHLLGSFLSPLHNKRTDEFGGDIHGRLKLPLEVIRRIRAKVGPGFPILVRISGAEFEPGGRTLEETQYIAPFFVEAGADALNVSGGTTNIGSVAPPMGSPTGIYAALAAAIKEVVKIPIISVGRILTPWVAEDILSSGKADLVAMGRTLLADPEFPRKAAAGDWEEIAPCVGDLHCLMSLYSDKTIACLVNAATGREEEMALVSTKSPKKILVVGGGPGGLEAARVAALRGHRVTLMEKSSKLGGQLLAASFPPTKQEFSCLIKYLASQAHKSGVKVELNKEATPEVIDEFHPDAVIIATGGLPQFPPKFCGIDRKHIVNSWDVLTGQVLPGQKVLVIGGGSTGCETADFLAHPFDDLSPKGNRVTIMEMLDDVCLDELSPRRSLLILRLRQKGVKIITRARVTDILEDGVIYLHNEETKTLRGIDTIVLATGTRPNNTLMEEIKGKAIPTYVIGDAKSPRNAVQAIAEGAEIGRQI
jgi:2,4-dienoyl-CoA reductase-like NADH-dependent reductase (Old Yellow Enzyme family)/pyruvate/2-oxoglutarate dehydrogenase complex dihydrolipoamide dehydrogenase (E3) component